MLVPEYQADTAPIGLHVLRLACFNRRVALDQSETPWITAYAHFPDRQCKHPATKNISYVSACKCQKIGLIQLRLQIGRCFNRMVALDPSES